MIATTAEFVVKKSKIDQVKKAIEKFVQAVHVSEPGTKIYVSLQDEENEFRFLHFMIFESEGAEVKHNNAPYTSDFTGVLHPNIKSEPIFRKYIYVAGL